jgi:hypothetical protein
MPSALEIVTALDSERRARRRAVFARILALAQAKVVAQGRAGARRCVFSVPLFLLGQPPYDWRRARSWVARRLAREGFEVRAPPDTPAIEIDWAHALARPRADAPPTEAAPPLEASLESPLAALHAAARSAAARR